MATIIIRKYFKVFCRDGTVSRKYEVFAYMTYFLVSSISCLFIEEPVVMLVTNFMLLCILSFSYLSGFHYGKLAIAIMYFSLVAIEVAVVIISQYMVVNPNISAKDNMILSCVLVRMMSYAFVQIVYSLYKMKQEFKVPKFYWFGLLVIPTSTIVLLLSLLSRESISSFWVLASLSCIFMINVSTFYLYEQLLKTMKSFLEELLTQEQHKYYDHQLMMMTDLLQDTRKLKHDLKNKLAPIYELEKAGQSKEASLHISKMIDACFTAREYSATGNSVVDSILNFKLAQAEKNGVSITTELYIPKDIEVEALDMAVILGNLLDNAIEGIQTKPEDAELDVSMNYSKGRLWIVISNSFDGVVLTKNNKMHSRKVDKLEHGLGLDSVRDVLHKYDGIMEIEYIEQIFRVKILLYL